MPVGLFSYILGEVRIGVRNVGNLIQYHNVTLSSGFSCPLTHNIKGALNLPQTKTLKFRLFGQKLNIKLYFSQWEKMFHLLVHKQHDIFRSFAVK